MLSQRNTVLTLLVVILTIISLTKTTLVQAELGYQIDHDHGYRLRLMSNTKYECKLTFPKFYHLNEKSAEVSITAYETDPFVVENGKGSIVSIQNNIVHFKAEVASTKGYQNQECYVFINYSKITDVPDENDPDHDDEITLECLEKGGDSQNPDDFEELDLIYAGADFSRRFKPHKGSYGMKINYSKTSFKSLSVENIPYDLEDDDYVMIMITRYHQFRSESPNFTFDETKSPCNVIIDKKKFPLEFDSESGEGYLELKFTDNTPTIKKGTSLSISCSGVNLDSDEIGWGKDKDAYVTVYFGAGDRYLVDYLPNSASLYVSSAAMIITVVAACIGLIM